MTLTRVFTARKIATTWTLNALQTFFARVQESTEVHGTGNWKGTGWATCEYNKSWRDLRKSKIRCEREIILHCKKNDNLPVNRVWVELNFTLHRVWKPRLSKVSDRETLLSKSLFVPSGGTNKEPWELICRERCQSS